MRVVVDQQTATRIQALRDSGELTLQQIADEVGVSRQTVRRVLNPDLRRRDRQSSVGWKDRHRDANRARDRARSATPEQRGICERCGGLKGVSGVRARHCVRCVGEIRDERWDRLEVLWLAGRSTREIMAEMGMAKGTVSSEIDAMRKAGRNAPHRYDVR